MKIHKSYNSRNLIQHIKNMRILDIFIKCFNDYNHQHTLVIFDIDDVLITPTNNYDFWYPTPEQLLEKKQRLISNSTYPDSSSIFTTDYILVDPKIIDIFKLLKNKKVPTIALTAMGSGRFGIISSLEDLRIETLKKLDLDFSQMSQLKHDLILPDELKDLTTNCSTWIGQPMFKHGIIFSAGIDKGTILEWILNKNDYHPKNIIFIDDKLTNLTSLSQLCTKLGINFYGFHYTAEFLEHKLASDKINQTEIKLLGNKGPIPKI